MPDLHVTECALCHQTDDHPKKSFFHGDAWTDRHYDCSAAAGDDDSARLVIAADGAKGDQLRTFITEQVSV